MKYPKKTLIAAFLLPLYFSLLLPAPGLLAFEEKTVSSAESSLIPVKTPADAQTEIPLPAQTFETDPNDFFNDNPLSLPDPVLSPELKAAAEVFIAGLDPFEENSSEADAAGKKSSGTSSSWGLSAVNAQQAWALTRGAGVTIAVIDTGLDFNHEDIKNNYYINNAELNGLPGVDDDGNGFIDDFRGWDFVNDDNNPTDDNGHGTHVSGIAAADSTNSKGIAGVAPDAKILAVKVLGSTGSGTIANVIDGIKYAADLGAQIINMSLGILKKYLTQPLLAAFQDAVDYAANKGSIVITAAGNDGVDTALTAPAGLGHTIAAGAVDASLKKPSWSNKNPDLVAPGVNILSLKAGGGYFSLSGTSMSSPFVAGAAALIVSYFHPLYESLSYTGEQIYEDVYARLTQSARSLSKKDFDANFGYGLLDVYQALTLSPGALVFSGQNNSFAFSGVPGFSSALSAAGFEEGAAAPGPGSFFSRHTHSGNWYQIGAFEARSKKAKNILTRRLPPLFFRK